MTIAALRHPRGFTLSQDRPLTPAMVRGVALSSGLGCPPGLGEFRRDRRRAGTGFGFFDEAAAWYEENVPDEAKEVIETGAKVGLKKATEEIKESGGIYVPVVPAAKSPTGQALTHDDVDTFIMLSEQGHLFEPAAYAAFGLPAPPSKVVKAGGVSFTQIDKPHPKAIWDVARAVWKMPGATDGPVTTSPEVIAQYHAAGLRKTVPTRIGEAASLVGAGQWEAARTIVEKLVLVLASPQTERTAELGLLPERQQWLEALSDIVSEFPTGEAPSAAAAGQVPAGGVLDLSKPGARQWLETAIAAGTVKIEGNKVVGADGSVYEFKGGTPGYSPGSKVGGGAGAGLLLLLGVGALLFFGRK